MQLFYDANINSGTSEYEIIGQEAKHIAKVLRHQPGDLVQITNGNGFIARTEIVSVSSKAVRFRIIDRKHITAPLYHNITLAVGLLKNKDRMEWLAEKATELGVGSIVWMHTNRSERGKIRLDRIEAVMISAMKQSLQAWLPTTSMATFQQVMDDCALKTIPIVMAHETSEHIVQPSYMQDLNNAVLLIGPEGGFTPDEVENVVKSGGKSLLLGVNRLRSETAALTLLQYYHLSNTSRISINESLRSVISG